MKMWSLEYLTMRIQHQITPAKTNLYRRLFPEKADNQKADKTKSR
jgi:hypothetical protein